MKREKQIAFNMLNEAKSKIGNDGIVIKNHHNLNDKEIVELMLSFHEQLNNQQDPFTKSVCPKCGTINIYQEESGIWCYECEKFFDD